ncbi:MAG: carbohydrate kinase family protein, partial [Anaerolineaceae bacterium]|nr:carbohydrate kinase family protein [Anaerolineaceae bacterium]
KCGNDTFGQFMLEEMQKNQIDTSHIIRVNGGSTGLSVILNRGVDRAILTFPGLISALQAGEIPDDLLGQARHLHVASYFLQTSLAENLPDLFSRARSLGLSTSLDTNYDPTEQWSGFDTLLAVTNVFLPNEIEACSLTGTKEVIAAADILQKKVNTLAIKMGAKGALGVKSGQQVQVSSLDVKVVDTIGAGDSFDAGFLYGYLNDWPLEKMLRLGTVCGALSTQKAGGPTGQPTLSEAQKYL